jgi:fumarylpyruvate hydrolase
VVCTLNFHLNQRIARLTMIWSPPESVVQLSRQVSLEAGDLTFAGTPAAVGAVVSDDSILLDIDPFTIAIGKRASC